MEKGGSDRREIFFLNKLISENLMSLDLLILSFKKKKNCK